MKKTAAIVVLIIMFAGIVRAQDNTQKQTGWKVTSFSFSFGFSGVFMENTNTDYENLKNSVENPELFIDPSGFSNEQFFNNAGGNFSPKISIGITPYSKKRGEYRNNRELRFTVGSNVGTRRSFSFYNTEAVVVDTFVSVNGNPNMYSDSVTSGSYSYFENFADVNFGISYLFKTDVEKRVWLYAGVGAEYGISIINYVSVNSYENKSVNYYSEGERPDYDEGGGNYYYPYYYYNSSYSDSYEKTSLKKATHFVRTFIPMGINFRISNGNPFFRHVNIYSEFSPGVEFQVVPGDKTYVNPYFGVAFVGFSYRW